jgi:hypothetical protein
MTTFGIFLLDLLGIALSAWIFNLIRRDKLYVGYGTILLISIAAIMVGVSLAPLRALGESILEIFFPASALTLAAFGYLFLMLIYVLTQITILSDRLAEFVQDAAIREAHLKSVSRAKALAPTDISQESGDNT